MGDQVGNLAGVMAPVSAPNSFGDAVLPRLLTTDLTLDLETESFFSDDSLSIRSLSPECILPNKIHVSASPGALASRSQAAVLEFPKLPEFLPVHDFVTFGPARTIARG